VSERPDEEIFLPPPRRADAEELPPPDAADPVIEAYKRDVDRTLLRQNLWRPLKQRCETFEGFMAAVCQLRGAAKRR
jgi:hypothetical protein